MTPAERRMTRARPARVLPATVGTTVCLTLLLSAPQAVALVPGAQGERTNAMQPPAQPITSPIVVLGASYARGWKVDGRCRPAVD